jgi:hypothetical protein
MPSDRSLPSRGLAEVRIIAASPDAARRVAETLRRRFAATEQRSYPAGDGGAGTRLHLTVDVARSPQAPQAPEPSGPFPLRLVTSLPHADEIQDAAGKNGTDQGFVTLPLGGMRVSRKRS